MRKLVIPKNYEENSYAHAMVGGIISNVDEFYNRYCAMRNRIEKNARRRGKLPTREELVRLRSFGTLIRDAHKEWGMYGTTWRKEKGDTLCARLWLADYILEEISL